jgi:hypothetical protein
MGVAHHTKVAQHITSKKNFNLNPKAYTQGPCMIAKNGWASGERSLK